MIAARVMVATAGILVLAVAIPSGVAALAYGHRRLAYGLMLGAALIISLGLLGGGKL